MKTKIFITGIQGVIGWNLYRALQDRYEVSGFSREKKCDQGEWYGGLLEDYRRISGVIRKTDPDIVVHTQAMCNLDLCEIKPDKTHLVNVEATEALLRAVDPKRHRFVYVSSDHVFSGCRGNYDETAPPDPLSVYGKTRAEAEALVLRRVPEALILRPGLVLGPSLQGNIGPHDFLRSRLKQGKPASYFTDEFRSPLWAGDFIEGFCLLTEKRRRGIYHLGGAERLSRYAIASELAAVWDLPGSVLPKTRAEDRDVPRIGDCTLNSGKAEREGWKAPGFSRSFSCTNGVSASRI